MVMDLVREFPLAEIGQEYAATSMKLTTREEIFSAMVVCGFLSSEGGRVSIANKEPHMDETSIQRNKEKDKLDCADRENWGKQTSSLFPQVFLDYAAVWAGPDNSPPIHGNGDSPGDIP